MKDWREAEVSEKECGIKETEGLNLVHTEGTERGSGGQRGSGRPVSAKGWRQSSLYNDNALIEKEGTE